MTPYNEWEVCILTFKVCQPGDEKNQQRKVIKAMTLSDFKLLTTLFYVLAKYLRFNRLLKFYVQGKGEDSFNCIEKSSQSGYKLCQWTRIV